MKTNVFKYFMTTNVKLMFATQLRLGRLGGERGNDGSHDGNER